MARPVLLVAGGSRGIGAAVARLAGKSGYDVAVNYKSNAAAAQEVVAAVNASGGQALAIQGDLAREDDIERTFNAAEKLGPLTHFVHSSGITGKASRLDSVSAQTVREVLDVNTYGAILCLRAALQRMSTRNGGAGGSIVMITSMAASIGGAGEYTWYAAAKAAVNTLVLGTAREVAKENVRINGVSPGLIDTEIHEPGRLERVAPSVPVGRAGKADEVADAVLYLLSDAASYVTGSILNVSGAR
ncbi:MAG: Oxidoreductase, short-chain dehydrogenase/reductase family [Pseudolabrys sp.]|jgi:NAD(P)-dependent dehydrogenase (short-subunit alcohol dehydrogenase family)|nr:Oxidoreductase, short-chain dehydrogenase/reductase family [Pseudolabrys sp.]